MTNETASLWARLTALTNIINELSARVLALEQRLAVAEESLGGRWFS